MVSTITPIMVDGVRVVVPDSLDLVTPYVLLEQQDWFEDEIKFLRRLLQPGQKVIDIGANYGVYTLSMAQTVGPTGCVWAFEPSSGTARLLAEGIAVNGFPQVVLQQSALSSASGTAQLSIKKDSELNALVRGEPSTGPSETVPLVTLDECMERYGWRDIEFVKIDTEGEESNILKGGKRFFGELSPIVQYKIQAGANLHMELVQEFAALGYGSYRLVVGLDLLVPFDANSAPDKSILNLICCKPDRVEGLAARGFLLNSAHHSPATATDRLRNISEKVRNRHEYNWRHTVATMPYGTRLANLWETTMAAGNSVEVEVALALYAFSRDSAQSASERFAALEASFSMFRILCAREPSYLRLASLARVARDYGAPTLAAEALQQLSNAMLKRNQIDPKEPFLAPGERFDSVPCDKTIGKWVLAAVLEEFERLGSVSSFYEGAAARPRLELIHALGFGSAEMERRLRLLQRRFDLPMS